MVAVNAPIPEFTYNLAAFFSNAKKLLPVFHRYMGFARQDPEFLNTLTNVLMSTPLMIRVQNILHSPTLFTNYLAALKLDNPSASHTQVMQSIQSFLSTLPASTRLQVQKAFAETEASDSMGLSTSTLETAFQLLHLDTQLYIDFLTTLQLNQTRNMPWNTVVSKIRTIVNAKKPYAWPGMNQFLNNLHWGHYQEQYGYSSEAGYGEAYYDDYGEHENDDIVERVEGVDYHLDEQDDHEIGVFKECSLAHESSSNEGGVNTKGVSANQSVVDRFAELSVTDKRPVVKTF
ncbi:hypothetical protein BGX27_007185 [Mortierella sp. AM989]|nr:hypothetical protein BGX27_007185 [Mortierella sp. AM989]